MQQVDYSNAFMQAEIENDIYVTLPESFIAPINGNFILKLWKSHMIMRKPIGMAESKRVCC